MPFSLKARHLGRYKDIARLFYKYGRSDLADATMLDDIAPENGRASQTPHSTTSTSTASDPPEAMQLAADLEKMGPIFVKVGQLLSTRADLLPAPYIAALSRLQDHVHPVPFEEIEEIVCTELGIRLSRAFSSFDREPVSAASLGQVHRAALRDGRPVAVKVQRPKIREQMADDLDALHEVAEFLDNHTEIGKRYEFQRILDEFRKTLIAELDYRLEAENLRNVGANLREFNRIIVPKPIMDYTTSRVLTMEFISGYKITALSPVVKTELDGAVLGEELFKAYLHQILVDGLFHADPHPGNLLLTEDSRIALIDLGMVGRISPSMRDHLLRMLIAIADQRSEDVAEIALSLSERKDDFDERAFKRRLDDLIGRNQNKSLENLAIGKTVLDLHRLAADSGLRAPIELCTLGKTLLNLDQTGETLDPDFNPNEAIKRNVASILQRNLLHQLAPGNIYSAILDIKEFLAHLPRKITRILDTVANNELKLNVDAIDEDKLMGGFQKVANRITVGLILAALIIGAALLMRIDTPNRLFGYPALAIVLFMLAALGGLALVIHIIFYDDHT